MDQAFDMSVYLRALRRRWLLIAGPLVVCAALAALVAALLPPVYKSTARILVESQQIPEELARSTITSGPAERIRLIEQRLMTRQNLLEVADRLNVFAGRNMSPNDIVLAMREASSIELVALGTQGRGNITASVVNISFESSSPEVASRVANELLTRLMEQNVRQRSSRASETLEFFSREAERLSRGLNLVEDRITAFKRENENSLPESLAFRRSELARLEDRVFERENRRIVLNEQVRQIREQIAAGRVAVVGRDLTPEERELEQLRRALAQQRAVLADSHPTIRALSLRIAALERLIQPVGGGTATDAENGSAMSESARLLDQLQRQIAQLDDQDAVEAARILLLEQSIEQTPAVEITLNGLQREQASLQMQLGQALSRRADAETGERLEASQRAERFEVIEQAQTPVKPISPNRPLIVAAGFVGGGALGFGLMILAELLNRSLRTSADLERELDLRAVVSIPYIVTDAELRRRRWLWRGVLGAAVIGLPMALLAVDRFYLPLPVLAADAMRATGFERLLGKIEGLFSR